MKLAPELESGLQEIVKHKRGYIAQMEAHRTLQKRWGYGKLAHITKSHIDDDRDHVKAINSYIAERDGIPLNERGEVSVQSDAPGQIDADLENEIECVKRLNDFIVAARNGREDKARRIIEHVLADDENHVARLEKQQNLIKTMGLPNYLAKVSKA